MIFVRNPNYMLAKGVRPAVAIGNFDGMHRGHQALLHTLVATSREKRVPSLLLTFEPLPHEFFQKPISRIMPLREKIQYCASQGLDFLCCLKFNRAFSMLSAKAFVQTILIKTLQVTTVIVGEDFRFGYQRKGDTRLLQQFADTGAFELKVVPKIEHQHQKIGSSWLRQLLEMGDFKGYEALCGHPFELSGRVIKGQQLGRQLGFPTANLRLKHPMDYPLAGVYGVKVTLSDVEDWHLGAMNVGVRPSIQGIKRQVEVHLLAFNEILYGKRLIVRPEFKIRAEQSFPDLTTLKSQIMKDIEIITSRLAIK